MTESCLEGRLGEVRRAIKKGGTWEAIAQDLGVGVTALRGFCQKYGIIKARVRSCARGVDYYATIGGPIGADGETQRRRREEEANELFGLCMAGRRFQARPAEPAIGRLPPRRDPAEGMGGSSLA